MSDPAAPSGSGADVLLDVGLTGGIASGKSTVDDVLRICGAHIIDADRIVHSLLTPGRPEHAQVVRRFGQTIVDGQGEIDRQALAAIVFRDPSARADLNAILHPAVGREEARLKEDLRARGVGIAITDAALLVEAGRAGAYDRLVVVACPRSLQLSRLLARHPDWHAEEAVARIDAQGPLEDKIALADYVIDTSGSLADTERRAHHVHVLLHEDLEARRAGRPLPDRPVIGPEPFLEP
ncbi:MAG: dephospho-CoA kinase [Acidobacteriota bacterium]